MFTVITFSYSTVQYVNRTNQGLIYSDNLISPNNFSNLRYSIKRNMKEWFSYLATSFNYLPEDNLKNTYFKNNGIAETQFDTESEIVIENANVTNLGTPKLTPNVYMTKLVCSFDNAVTILNALKTINPDNTIGGFIRTVDQNGKVIKGYPKKLEYEPSTETLTATLEERFESDVVTIETSGNDLIINETGYDSKTLAETWYEISGDYLQLYDRKGIAIINPTRYDFVVIDGLTFANPIELSNKLIEIN